ncbi:hypothetical protein N7527_003542, partial [Penicillium freii]
GDQSGCYQSADCPEAVKPATVRLVNVGELKWIIESADCPEAGKPATVRLVNASVPGFMRWGLDVE